MPSYRVTATKGTLCPEHKAKLARAITAAHSDITGADAFFAQVMFHDLESSDFFLGGTPVEGQQIFVHAFIRVRPLELEEKLIGRLLASTIETTGLPSRFIWVYVSDLPKELMIEYGHVLPKPGQEAKWKEAFPAVDLEYMQRTEYTRPR
jgi:phenylpyruvate tautomerase PptA (4-oxalocrotonate tautomerase family)